MTEAVNLNENETDVTVVEKPETPLTVTVNQNFPLLPPGHVFLGGGDLNKKYEQFLDQLFTLSIQALDKDAIEARKAKGKTISQTTIKSLNRLQALTALSDLVSKNRTINFRFVGVQLSKKLNFEQVLLGYLEKHQHTLQSMKSYL